MGILVPEYATKWGLTLPVYISHASKEIRITPLHEKNGVSKWVVNGDFAVYNSREDRLRNPYGGVMDIISLNITVDSETFNTSTAFQILYGKLYEMFPDAEREDNVYPEVMPIVELTQTPVPSQEPSMPSPEPVVDPMVIDPSSSNVDTNYLSSSNVDTNYLT